VSAEGTLDLPVGILGVPIEVVLHIQKSAPLRFEVSPLAPGELRDVGDMRFEGGRTVLLRVVDAQGAPVVGAAVQLDDPSSGLLFVDGSLANGTDGKGERVFSRMQRSSFLVAVTPPERAPYLFAIPAETVGPVVLRLEPEGTLEIRVAERDGSPAAAARVTLLAAEPDPYEREPDELTQHEKADASGVWRGRVQPRTYRLVVRSLSFEGETKTTAAVRSGETTAITVRLP
jgi:hypothetical protein